MAERLKHQPFASGGLPTERWAAGPTSPGLRAPPTSTPASGTFPSNENTSQEAGASATREAQETSGPAPAGMSGTFHPTEKASHEAGESAAREAQETSGQRPTVP
ncbi:MAG: hypothetical protein NVS3B18_09960 [Candidatus Dormibacteria bacterium]